MLITSAADRALKFLVGCWGDAFLNPYTLAAPKHLTLFRCETYLFEMINTKPHGSGEKPTYRLLGTERYQLFRNDANARYDRRRITRQD